MKKMQNLALKRASIRELSPRELRVTGGLVDCIPYPIPDPMSIDCASRGPRCDRDYL
jgi:hypothetical protein